MKLKTLVFSLVAISLNLAGCGRNQNLFDSLLSGEGLTPGKSPTSAAPQGLGLVPFYEAASATTIQGQLRTKIDVFMTLDNSGSMNYRIPDLAAGVGAFAMRLKAKGIDFRIGVGKSTERNATALSYEESVLGPYPVVVTADADAGARLQMNFLSIQSMFQGGLEIPLGLITSSFGWPSMQSFYRAGVPRYYVAVSDAEDGFYSFSDHDQFVAELQLASGGQPYAVSAIGIPSWSACDGTEVNAQPLLEKAVASTGGVMDSVCSVNPGAAFEGIGDGAAALLTEVPLRDLVSSGRRVDSASVAVKVGSFDVPNDPANGFKWIAGKNALYFPGTYQPAPGASISVRFDYEEL